MLTKKQFEANLKSWHSHYTIEELDKGYEEYQNFMKKFTR